MINDVHVHQNKRHNNHHDNHNDHNKTSEKRRLIFVRQNLFLQYEGVSRGLALVEDKFKEIFY